MKRVVIHAGAPRTGTTSVQYCLISKRQQLLDDGVVYPAVDFDININRSPRSTVDLGDAFDYNPSHFSLFQPMLTNPPPHVAERVSEFDEMRTIWRSILRDFRDGSSHTLILSWEALFNSAPRVDLSFLLDQLSGIPIELAVVLRHPVSWLNSLYAQSITGFARTQCGLADWSRARAHLRRGYAGSLNILTSALPLSRPIRIGFFDDYLQSERTLTQEFLRLIDVDEKHGDVALDINASQTAEMVLFLRQCNAASVSTQTFDEIANTGFSGVLDDATIGKASFIHPSLQQQLEEKYDQDLQIIKKRFQAEPLKAVGTLAHHQYIDDLTPARMQEIGRLLAPHLSEFANDELGRLISA